MNIDKLLMEWLHNKEFSQELLELAKQNHIYTTQNSLFRLWRIEIDDIDALINYEEFQKSLTPADQKVLRKDEYLSLTNTSLDCLFELKIKYYTQQKARSHSRSIKGCQYFINNHAEQTTFERLPCFITKIENADGVDLASLGNKRNANPKIIQEFKDMEEILSDYDYQKNSFKILEYPEIQIWSNNGELQSARSVDTNINNL